MTLSSPGRSVSMCLLLLIGISLAGSRWATLPLAPIVPAETRAQLTTELTHKAQSLLDFAYGPGQAVVELNLEMDQSELEVETAKTEGQGLPLKQSEIRERATGYENFKKHSELAYNTCNVRQHYTRERVGRLHCVIALKPNLDLNQAVQVVSCLMGIQAERGDSIVAFQRV